MSRASPSVLVMHDTPAQVAPALEPRFPDIRFRYATQSVDVEDALATWRPEVVLSIKCPGLPGPVHRLASTADTVCWLHVGGSGYDHLLPLDQTTPTLTNSAGVLSGFLAETVLGAMLSLNGHFPAYQRQADARVWQPIPFRPLGEQTLLVVGLGLIGSALAERASALGMRVLATRRTPQPAPAVEEMFAHDRLHDIIGEADYVSIHLRLEESTRRLFDADLIGRMRPGSVLINTSRGPVLDEQALLEALDKRHLSGAYLDVFETEPLPQNSPLWGRDDVMLTPHAADQIDNWPYRFAELFADNLERWIAGRPLVNVVHQS